jgi:hypothetical protein
MKEEISDFQSKSYSAPSSSPKMLIPGFIISGRDGFKNEKCLFLQCHVISLIIFPKLSVSVLLFLDDTSYTDEAC